ncbi:MAG: hypothetical protein K0R63_1498 [Rickettsiales bacterium]|jgi:hypothetical protein|nr:hypothetical protein [Rickettsiales bacterium]
MVQKYFMLAVVVSLVSACSLTANPGRTKVSAGGVTIENGGGGNGGKFCPPGQAKKGNC